MILSHESRSLLRRGDMLDLTRPYPQKRTPPDNFVIEHRVYVSAEKNPNSIVEVSQVDSLLLCCPVVLAKRVYRVDLKPRSN